MAAFEPTPAQRQAIESRGAAILVSAGAGSGKTKVLTERLLAHLRDETDPVDLDSFLIITFTRAAAGELRGRIMEELAAALADDPGNRRLRRQSALCRRARISTIHGFCAELLREHSHLAGLSPDFRILEEDRADVMKEAALERTLETCYREPEKHPGFLQLADTVGAGRDDRRLADLVLDLHKKMQCHSRPADWAAEQVRLLNERRDDPGETVWGREILDAAARTAHYWSGEMERCLRLMREEEKIASAYGESFQTTAEALRELERCLAIGWEKARACLPIPYPKLSALRKNPAPDLSEHVKSRRDACKKAAETLQKTLEKDGTTLLNELASTAPAMRALLELTLLFDREYENDKSRAGLADYADLEHKAARLLTEPDDSPTELALQVRERYTEIMVDEYQDVSQVQDTIFRAISKEGSNLFLVGDVKQSIYRFRLADPRIFTEKYERFADADRAQPGEPRRILLRENFRSRREILEGANTVFRICMSKALGDIDYDDNAALRLGADYEGEVPLPRLTLLHAAEDTAGDGEKPDGTLLEARFVARRIRALIESGVTVSDHGNTRPACWGDVAILLRAANSVGGIYRRALAQEGIPVANGQGGGYFSSPEISGLVSLLAVIDNPHQDIPLLSVLRSPAFGFSADDLSRIRAGAKDADLYDALCVDAKTNGESAAFLDRLSRLRGEAPDLSAAELVWKLIEETDLLALCSAMNDGEQRRARLMEMTELSERFESSGYRGLHRFVLWLRRQAQKGQEPSLGASTTSAVQIVSVHKSKGLEYPIVFLCDLARRFNDADSQGTVLVHPKLGLGPKLTDLERRVEYPTIARSAIQMRLRRETRAEELRLLYVAMTRPKERLFMTAFCRDPEKMKNERSASLSEPMDPEVLSAAGAPLDWLLSAALLDGGRHLELCVRDCAEEPRDGDPAEKAAEPDAETLAELRRRLAFVYPHRAAEMLPSKVTATGLKERGGPEEDAEAAALLPPRHRPFRMPDFSKAERPVTGAERGTATHLVLQHMDFSAADSLAAVKREIEALRERGLLTEREAAAVDARAIAKLMRSPLGKRMRSAKTLHREFRFSLLCDAGMLSPGARGEKVLLQGVVDCFLEEGDSLTVIDYKTDRLRDRDEAEKRADFYRPQLMAYAGALERITGKRVGTCALVFLSAGETVFLEPDA